MGDYKVTVMAAYTALPVGPLPAVHSVLTSSVPPLRDLLWLFSGKELLPLQRSVPLPAFLFLLVYSLSVIISFILFYIFHFNLLFYSY